jgi:hypothetical protein
MKVVIDIAIYTRDSGAFGNVSGAIDVSFEPHVGDSISFLPTKAGKEMPSTFTGLVHVEGRTITAGGDSHGLMLSLEDITVETVADAQDLLAFFEDAHGLFANVFDKDDE